MAEERLSLSEAEATGHAPTAPGSQPTSRPVKRAIEGPKIPAPKEEPPKKPPRFFPRSPFLEIRGVPRPPFVPSAPSAALKVPGASSFHRPYEDEVYDLIARTRQVGVVGFEKQYEQEINALAEHYGPSVSPPPGMGFAGNGAGFIKASLANYVRHVAALEAKVGGYRFTGQSQLGLPLYRFGAKPPEMPDGRMTPEVDVYGGYYVDPRKSEYRKRLTGEWRGNFATAAQAMLQGARAVAGGGKGFEPTQVRTLGGRPAISGKEMFGEEVGTVGAVAGKLGLEAMLTRGLGRAVRGSLAARAAAEGSQEGVKAARALRTLTPAELAEAPFRRKLGEWGFDAASGVFGIYAQERWLAPLDTRIRASLEMRSKIENWTPAMMETAVLDARRQVAMGAAQAYAALSILSPGFAKASEWATSKGKWGAYAVRVGAEPAALAGGFMVLDPEVWDLVRQGDWKSVTAKFMGAGVPFAIFGLRSAWRDIKHHEYKAKEAERLLNPKTPEDHSIVEQERVLAQMAGDTSPGALDRAAEKRALARLEAEEGPVDAEISRTLDAASLRQVREAESAIAGMPRVEAREASEPVFNVVYWARNLERSIASGSSRGVAEATEGFFDALGALGTIAKKTGTDIGAAISAARKVFNPLEQGSLARMDVQQASLALGALLREVGGWSGKIGQVIGELRDTLKRPGQARLGEAEGRPSVPRSAEEESRFEDAVSDVMGQADVWYGKPEVQSGLADIVGEAHKLDRATARRVLEEAADRIATQRGEAGPTPSEGPPAAPPKPAPAPQPPPAPPTLAERIRQALTTAAQPGFEAAMRQPMTDAELAARVRAGGARSMRGLSIKPGGKATGPIVRWREGEVWAEARGPEALRKIREAFGTPVKEGAPPAAPAAPVGTEGAKAETGAKPGELFAGAQAPPTEPGVSRETPPKARTPVDTAIDALAKAWGVTDLDSVRKFLETKDPRTRAAALKHLFPEMVPKKDDAEGVTKWISFVEERTREARDALGTAELAGESPAADVAATIAKRTPAGRRALFENLAPQLAEKWNMSAEAVKNLLRAGKAGFEDALKKVFPTTAKGPKGEWKVFVSQMRRQVEEAYDAARKQAEKTRKTVSEAVGQMYRSLVEARSALEGGSLADAAAESKSASRIAEIASQAKAVMSLLRGTEGLISPTEAVATIRALRAAGASAMAASQVASNPLVQRHLAEGIKKGQAAEEVIKHFATTFGEGIAQGRPASTTTPTPGEIEAGKYTPEGREIAGRAADINRKGQEGFISGPLAPFAPFARMFEEMAGVVYDAYSKGPGDILKSLDLAARAPKHAGLATWWGDPIVYFGPTVMDAWIKPYYRHHLRFARLVRLIKGESRWDVTLLRMMPSGKGKTVTSRLTPAEDHAIHKVLQIKEHDKTWISFVGELNRRTGKPLTEQELRDALPGMDLSKKVGESLDALPAHFKEAGDFLKLILERIRREHATWQLEPDIEMAVKQSERARVVMARLDREQGIQRLQKALDKRATEFDRADAIFRNSPRPTENMRERRDAKRADMERAQAALDTATKRRRGAELDVERLTERVRYLREEAWKEWGLENYFPEISHQAWKLTRDIEGLLASEELALTGPQENPRVSVVVGDPFTVHREEKTFWNRFATELAEMPEVGWGATDAVVQRLFKHEMHVGSLDANKKILTAFYGRLAPIGRWEHAMGATDPLAPAFDIELGQRVLYKGKEKVTVEDPNRPGTQIQKVSHFIFEPVNGGEKIFVPAEELRRRIWTYRGGLLEKGYDAKFLADRAEAIRKSFGGGISKRERAILDNRTKRAFFNAYSVFGMALRWARLQGISLAGGTNQLLYGLKDAAAAGVPILHSLRAARTLFEFQSGTLKGPQAKQLIRVLLESGIGVESMSRMHVGEAPVIQKFFASKVIQSAWSPFRTGEMGQRAIAAYGAYLAEVANLTGGKGLVKPRPRFERELAAAKTPQERDALVSARKAEEEAVSRKAMEVARKASVYGQLSMAAGAMPLVMHHPIWRQMFFLNNPTYRHNAQRWFHVTRFLQSVAFSASSRLSGATGKEHRYLERPDGSTVMMVRKKGTKPGDASEVEASPQVRKAREFLMQKAEWAESSRPHLLQPFVRAWMTSLVFDHLMRAAGLDWGSQVSMQITKLPGVSSMLPTTDDPYAREKWGQLFGYGFEHFDPLQNLPGEVLGRLGWAAIQSIRDGDSRHLASEWPKVRHKLYPRGLDPLMTLTQEDSDGNGNYPVYRGGEIYSYQNGDDLKRRFWIGGAGASRRVFPLGLEAGFEGLFAGEEKTKGVGEVDTYLRAKEAWVAQDRAREASALAWDSFRRALARGDKDAALEIYEKDLAGKLRKNVEQAAVAEQKIRSILDVQVQQLFDIADRYVLFTQAPMLIEALKTEKQAFQAEKILEARSRTIGEIHDPRVQKAVAEAGRKAILAAKKRRAELAK